MWSRPKTWVLLALLCTGAGVLVPEGFWLCLPALVLAIAALRRPADDNPRLPAWVAASAAGLVLLTVFTVRVAVPNIVSAGNSANHGLAVSTLRTLLWAEDQLVARAGRAGTLAELAGRAPLGDAPPLEVPLLRAELAPLGDRGVSVFSGYAYALHVRGDARFVAYAWPVLPGKSGLMAYCINEHEDIFEAALAEPGPPYAGFEVMPAWNACLAPGAAFGDRPREGVGGDGRHWSRWKGRGTRRSNRAPTPVAPGSAHGGP